VRDVSEPVADVAVALPSPALRGSIDRYIGYHLDGFAPGIHRGLPSRHLTFIVSLGPPIEVASMPDPAQPLASYAALAAGLHGRAVSIAHHGTQSGVSVELTPTHLRDPTVSRGPALPFVQDVPSRGDVRCAHG
jgi:hypothetical protein